jgi:hypothetical protein
MSVQKLYERYSTVIDEHKVGRLKIPAFIVASACMRVRYPLRVLHTILALGSVKGIIPIRYETELKGELAQKTRLFIGLQNTLSPRDLQGLVKHGASDPDCWTPVSLVTGMLERTARVELEVQPRNQFQLEMDHR